MQGLNSKCSLRCSVPTGIVIFGTVVGLLAAPHPALADLRFTPSLTVSERYDSNILLTSGGSDKDDFVTTVSPALSATYKGRPLEGTLSAGLGVSSYAKHSDLNYVSATGALNVDLTQLVSRLDKRTRLQISDTVYYTPELPAFVTNTVGLNPFATGIQPQRVRSLTNTVALTGGYTLTSRVNLNAAYSYAILSFGNTIGARPQAGAPGQTALFGTTIHSANAGTNVKLSTTDTLIFQGERCRRPFSQRLLIVQRDRRSALNQELSARNSAARRAHDQSFSADYLHLATEAQRHRERVISRG